MQAARGPPPGSAMKYFTFGGSIDVNRATAQWVPGTGPTGGAWNMDVDVNPATIERAQFFVEQTHIQLRMAQDPPSIVAKWMMAYWGHWKNSTTLTWLRARESKKL